MSISNNTNALSLMLWPSNNSLRWLCSNLQFLVNVFLSFYFLLVCFFQFVSGLGILFTVGNSCTLLLLFGSKDEQQVQQEDDAQQEDDEELHVVVVTWLFGETCQYDVMTEKVMQHYLLLDVSMGIYMMFYNLYCCMGFN